MVGKSHENQNTAGDEKQSGTSQNAEEESMDKSQEPEDRPKEEAGEESSETGDLKKELADAKAEAAETYDRLLRLSADFENYKKRVQRQMEEHKKFATEELIKDLLSVADNLERALNAAGEHKKAEVDDSMKEGIEMTLNEIRKILEKHNVTRIEALEKPFDPTYHEAIMQEESDEYPENTVIGEMQKGYMLHDRLIRPAMVVVSKARAG